MRKFPFFIAFINVLGVGLKHHPWRYWISSVFPLYLVMIEWAMYINGLDMDISHKASGLFLCPFKISFEYLRILILFLSRMAM